MSPYIFNRPEVITKIVSFIGSSMLDPLNLVAIEEDIGAISPGGPLHKIRTVLILDGETSPIQPISHRDE